MRNGAAVNLELVALGTVVTTVCASLGCSGGSEKIVAIRGEWTREGQSGRRLTTRHYDLFSTLSDTSFENALPGFLEAAHRRYASILPARNSANPRQIVYVFGTRPEWVRFTARNFTARFAIYSRIRSGGFTEGTVSVVLYTDRASTLAALAHEGWHQHVGTYAGDSIPAWLNEGLACYFETLEYKGDSSTLRPNKNSLRINALREAVQEGRLFSLREIINTDAGEVISRSSSEATQVYYAQVWALIVFLRHGAGERHAKAFDKLISDVAEGTFRVYAGAALLAPTDQRASAEESAFAAYFGELPGAFAEAYYDQVIRLCDF